MYYKIMFFGNQNTISLIYYIVWQDSFIYDDIKLFDWLMRIQKFKTWVHFAAQNRKNFKLNSKYNPSLVWNFLSGVTSIWRELATFQTWLQSFSVLFVFLILPSYHIQWTEVLFSREQEYQHDFPNQRYLSS